MSELLGREPQSLRYTAAVSGWKLPGQERQPPAERPSVILMADPQELHRRLLRDMLKQEGYRLLEASGVAEAVEVLQRAEVDLVILDLGLPGTSGLDLCRRLKSDPRTFLIPVVVTASLSGVETQVAVLAAGADEFLLRPLHAAVVRTRLAALLRQKAAVASLEEVEGVLYVLAQAVEQRDEAIGGHCHRLAYISAALGGALGLSQAQLLALNRGAYLHDIGKVSVPDSILFKPGPLSPQEWETMRQHPIKGEELCRPVKSLGPVLPIIRSHHERWDGSGYPDGLAGEEIPLPARILQVADIYDALTSPRPYKRPLPAPLAVEILLEETRNGWRDPELVRLFQEVWKATLWPPGRERRLQRIPPQRWTEPRAKPAPAALLK